MYKSLNIIIILYFWLHNENQIYESGKFFYKSSSLLTIENFKNHFFINFLIFNFSFWQNFASNKKGSESHPNSWGGWVWWKKFWNPLTCFKRRGGRKNPNYSNLEKSWIQNLTLIFEVSVGSEDISQIGRKTPATLTNASHLRAKTGCTNAKIFWHGPNPH